MGEGRGKGRECASCCYFCVRCHRCLGLHIQRYRKTVCCVFPQLASCYIYGSDPFLYLLSLSSCLFLYWQLIYIRLCIYHSLQYWLLNNCHITLSFYGDLIYPDLKVDRFIWAFARQQEPALFMIYMISTVLQ